MGFASLFTFARKEPVSGILTPAAGWTRVTATSVAVVRRRLVEPGDWVTPDSVLYEMFSGSGPTEGRPTGFKLLEDIELRRKAVERRLEAIVAQTENEKSRRINNSKAVKAQLAELEKEIDLHEQSLLFAERRARKMQPLVSTGALTELDVQKIEDLVTSRSITLAAAKRELIRIGGELDENEAMLSRLELDQKERLAGVSEALHALTMEETRVRAQNLSNVLAPREGRVASVRVGEGDWVQPGDILLDILPLEAGLQAQLFVGSDAVSGLETGQEVRVYLDAFPYDRYGAQHGKVLAISETPLGKPVNGMQNASDTRHPLFRVDVEFPAGFTLRAAEQRMLKPGMTVSADVVRDYGTLMDWALRPLRRTALRL